jgi:hypothetical protein
MEETEKYLDKLIILIDQQYAKYPNDLDKAIEEIFEEIILVMMQNILKAHLLKIILWMVFLEEEMKANY